MIKIQWLASIWRQNEQKWWVTSQNIQNYAKLRKWSNYNELHRFDVKRSKMLSFVANHSKPLNSQSDQLILNCIDLTSKRSKMMSYVANHSKPLNYKSDQLILTCIDLTSKRAKMMSYVAKHSKLRKTTKVINLYRITSIWYQNEQKWWVTSQNIQNYAKLRKWSNYNICIDLTSKRSTMMSYVANHSKPLNYKSDQLILTCIDLTSKRAKMMSYVAEQSKLRNTTKVINLYWITSIWRQNEQKWWVKSQNIQNYAKLRKWSNYNICIDLTSKRSTMMSYVANHSKPLNYKSDQLILNCIDLTSKRSKMLSYVANHSNR